jgi:hypothetical protein
MTAKKKPSKNMSAQDKQEILQQMMDKAASRRESNVELISKVKKDPKLAKRVRELLCKDLQRVATVPKQLGPSSSRDRYREIGHYSPVLVRYLIGAWPEFQRQAGLAESLGSKQVERNISKTLRAQQVMEYADSNVKPWDDAYSNLDMTSDEVVLQIGSDFHSSFCDPFALRVWFDVMKMEQPHGVRYNGDLVDFPSLSRHRQLPGAFAMSLQQECNFAKDSLLGRARKILPDADIKVVMGNHDIRMVTALADSGPMFLSMDSLKYAELLGLDEHEVGLVCRSTFLNPSAMMRKNDIAQNWETLPDAYGRPFYTTVHGFLTGKGSAQKHALRFGTNGTNGHMHNPESTTWGCLATGVVEWDQTGVMAYPPGVGAGYLPGPTESYGHVTTFNIVRLFPKARHVQTTQVKIGETMAYYGGYVWEITEEEQDAREDMLTI